MDSHEQLTNSSSNLINPLTRLINGTQFRWNESRVRLSPFAKISPKKQVRSGGTEKGNRKNQCHFTTFLFSKLP